MKIDHLLWGVRALEDGIREIGERTGVEPAPGGSHPGFGTRNALLALGEACYLEIVAPDPAQSELRSFGRYLANLEAPRLLTWAARTDDLDLLREKTRQHGLQPGEIHALSRRRPDGTRMSCRLFEIAGHEGGALVPFFIQFDQGVTHPARTAPAGCGLQRLVLRTQKPAELAGILRILELEGEVAIELAGGEEMVATLDAPRGRVDLRGRREAS
ncbi:MAG: VOC family protein [Thermoanaerobaculia bacterium]|nr:VOC family protein [Thermoanaerobaculia bacterium]